MAVRTREGLYSQPSTQTQDPQHQGALTSYSLTQGGGGEPGPGEVFTGRDIAQHPVRALPSPSAEEQCSISLSAVGNQFWNPPITSGKLEN